jgi:transmembrane protein EpsG
MLFFKKRILDNNPEAIESMNAMYIALFLLPLTFVNPSAMRAVQYYSVFLMLLIPEIISVFKKEERIFGYFAVGCLLIALFIRLQPRYMFFWQTFNKL